ncbi:hypothetical protein CB1_001048002 [Camelus ferus]|nr:hypothetical protein CB1_001048002 [Camelus ferus]
MDVGAVAKEKGKSILPDGAYHLHRVELFSTGWMLSLRSLLGPQQGFETNASGSTLEGNADHSSVPGAQRALDNDGSDVTWYMAYW